MDKGRLVKQRCILWVCCKAPRGEVKNMDEGLSKQEWQLFWITAQNVSFFQPDNISLILDENVMKTKGQWDRINKWNFNNIEGHNTVTFFKESTVVPEALVVIIRFAACWFYELQ